MPRCARRYAPVSSSITRCLPWAATLVTVAPLTSRTRPWVVTRSSVLPVNRGASDAAMRWIVSPSGMRLFGRRGRGGRRGCGCGCGGCRGCRALVRRRELAERVHRAHSLGEDLVELAEVPRAEQPDHHDERQVEPPRRALVGERVVERAPGARR